MKTTEEVKRRLIHCSAPCAVCISNYKEVDPEIETHDSETPVQYQYFQTLPQKHTLGISQHSHIGNVTMLPLARFSSPFWAK